MSKFLIFIFFSKNPIFAFKLENRKKFKLLIFSVKFGYIHIIKVVDQLQLVNLKMYKIY